MHFIRFAFISLLSLFLVITAISLLIPSTVRISRTTNIFSTKQDAKQELENIYKWKTWNPFFRDVDVPDNLKATGTEQKIDIKGTTVTLNLIQDSIVSATMTRDGRKPVRNAFTILPPHNDSIAVNWTMDFDLHWYPWEKFGSLFFEKTYRTRMEFGLATLKNNLHNSHSSQ